MNTWAKTGRTVGPEGTTITYIDLRETGLTIWVLRDGEELAEHWTLSGAKVWADRYAIERGLVNGPEE